ncbi:hypothetical protein tb265_36190 [Gemmatimonadetes bacterium T265]|nr:hypothetical protein tb265_36190 [Gemmatimonadetes bacterium T265]
MLESVRRHLPGAELVLSTWRGADVTGLPFDVLVESDDPGGLRCDGWPDTRSPAPLPYNANRQIVSSRNGLRAASRPYAMKLRSDMMLTGTGFLDYVGRYPARSPEWRVLRERVIVPNWWSQNPRGRSRKPFHPSDWFHFGRREDVLDVWDVPLADERMSLWYATRPHPPEYRDTHVSYRYTVEQYTWLAFLRKYGDVALEHAFDARAEMLSLSELTLANNLVVVDVAALGLRFLKYRNARAYWGSLYTHGEWQELYRLYCDPGYVCPPDPVRWRKELYARWVEPWHRVLTEPRSAAVVRRASTAWEARAPRSFRATRAAYLSGLSALSRAPWRRA